MAHTLSISMPGKLLTRGFWLYVWRVESPVGEIFYVGRTGDNSSPHAVAPYTRMGQHLGFSETQNALRKHLLKRGIDPEACTFHMVAHGPLFPEAADMVAHLAPRDIVAALERKLAEAMCAAGYDVLNTVKCRKPLDDAIWSAVQNEFAKHFVKLSPSPVLESRVRDEQLRLS